MSKYKRPINVWDRYKSEPNFYNWMCLTLHILKFRFSFFWNKPSLYKFVHLYRSYEPKWLAKLTCPSYALQCKIDDTIDKYIKKTKVKVVQKTYCEPADYNVDATYIIKKDGWEYPDGELNWKRGLENEVSNIWGLSEYAGAWKQDAMYKAKWNKMNWQYHFCHNVIKDFFGDLHEFLDKDKYDWYKYSWSEEEENTRERLEREGL